MDDGLNFGLQFAKMAGGLAVVLAALYACAYGLKRMGLRLKPAEGGRLIRIVASQTIGVKHQLVLLEVKGQTLLVGVSPQGIHLLTRLDQDAMDSTLTASPTAAAHDVSL